ncbi:hypothetical protein B0T16DRAFT_402737 [Cercophora newfieldiana]|uniref:Secreted protein n=1 Tax=Cercophora newfieldiana TaxID=92897 RepID=A0AA39YSS4_9PEZI|nr:hypothetical protein B0T16DRAFT_402737 [Cercophora newfieldiana]
MATFLTTRRLAMLLGRAAEVATNATATSPARMRSVDMTGMTRCCGKERQRAKTLGHVKNAKKSDLCERRA